jgi:hypothetical protein
VHGSLSCGTLLTREWDGHLQRVMVLADGFSWNGLSKVAFAMTGTRWSGPRFFGLRVTGQCCPYARPAIPWRVPAARDEGQLTNARLGLAVLERAGFFFGVGARFFGVASGATMAKISRSAASQ